LEQGFSASAAALLEEMSSAFSTGRIAGAYEKEPTEITPTTLEHFATTVFRPAFEKALSPTIARRQ
jgi:hypothetical protein